MTNCIFYSIIFYLFITFTTGSIRYSEINRTFMTIYRGIFEASTITIDEHGNQIVPYYNEKVLKTYLVTYFKENLDKYVTDYEISMHFFNRQDGTICTSGVCRDVNVTLKAKINSLFDYEKSQNFSVLTRDEI